MQAPIGQLQQDDQLAADKLHPLHGKQERVANGFDSLDRLQLVFGGGIDAVKRAHAAIHELDGFQKPSGRLAFPDLAEAAGTDGLDQSIARDGLHVPSLAKRRICCGTAFKNAGTGHGGYLLMPPM